MATLSLTTSMKTPFFLFVNVEDTHRLDTQAMFSKKKTKERSEITREITMHHTQCMYAMCSVLFFSPRFRIHNPTLSIEHKTHKTTHAKLLSRSISQLNSYNHMTKQIIIVRAHTITHSHTHTQSHRVTLCVRPNVIILEIFTIFRRLNFSSLLHCYFFFFSLNFSL